MINRSIHPYAVMANITVIGPDWNIIVASQETLSKYQSDLCLDILVYLSVSIGSPAGTTNTLLSCIPLGSYPGSIVTKLVVTAATAELLASITPYFSQLTATPMLALGAGLM